MTFGNYLIMKGYKVETLSGSKSTVHYYTKAIDDICDRERISCSDLVKSIDKYIEKYDVGGAEEDFGKKQHCTPINALRRFKEYIEFSRSNRQ